MDDKSISDALTEEPNECDINISKLSGYSAEIHYFQSIYHPMHVYCRLVDCGLNRDIAKVLSLLYEERFYSSTMRYIKRKYEKKQTQDVREST